MEEQVIRQGDGSVLLKEIDRILELPDGLSYTLMRKGIFSAHQIRKRTWVVTETELAYVIDRINRYRDKDPYHPKENMSIDEAMEVLKVGRNTVYTMANRGDIAWAQNETWKMPTRQSVSEYLYRREGRRLAI